MKKYKVLGIVVIFVIAVTTAGCVNLADIGPHSSPDHEISSQARLTSLPAALDANLAWHNAGLFEIANGWSNGGFFNATWRDSQVTFTQNHGGRMTLRLDWDSHGSNPPYQSGEYRSREFYHYGLYEVRMRAARGDGVVSSFFTYTGPSDNQPWDEIDIEFLGKDTTRMQTNYFTNGVGGKEVYIDLGFDAADSFNDYAFEWLPDRINWYVNGVLVHTEDGSKGAIPSHESKIMVNLWPGTGVDEWLNPFNNSNLPITAEYEYIRYTPYTESPLNPPSSGNPSSGNMISNGNFGNGNSGWHLGTYQGGNAYLNTNDAGLVQIWNGGSQVWSVQLIQEGLTLEQGATYRVSFDAASAFNRTIQVGVNQSVSPWGSFSGPVSFSLSPEWNHYSMQFEMNSPYEPNARLEINLGQSTGDVHFNNISVVRQ